MKKIKFPKIDIARLGEGALNLLKENSGTIAGGLTMIGMALLCKKLNLPYQVLTDPYSFESYGVTRSNGQTTKLVLIPNNSLEASMSALYEGISADDWESTKEDAANKIFSILSANRDDLQDSTKTYAINLIRGINEKSRWNSTKEHNNRLIARIGKGDI